MNKNTLNYHNIPARSGKADSLLVFLHGYGDSGRGILSLSAEFANLFPDTGFYAPDASFLCAHIPNGFKWFGVPWIDQINEKEMVKETSLSIGYINDFLDFISEKENIAPAKIFLFGFSQGAGMSLYIGPRRPEKFGGILAFSGMILGTDDLSQNIVTRPPIFIAHGTEDNIVAFANFNKIKRTFETLNFDHIDSYIMQDAPHTITPRALSHAQNFMHKHLYS